MQNNVNDNVQNEEQEVAPSFTNPALDGETNGAGEMEDMDETEVSQSREGVCTPSQRSAPQNGFSSDLSDDEGETEDMGETEGGGTYPHPPKETEGGGTYPHPPVDSYPSPPEPDFPSDDNYSQEDPLNPSEETEPSDANVFKVEKMVDVIIDSIQKTIEEIQSGIERHPPEIYRRILNFTIGQTESVLSFLSQAIHLSMKIQKYKNELLTREEEYELDETDKSILEDYFAKKLKV